MYKRHSICIFLVNLLSFGLVFVLKICSDSSKVYYESKCVRIEITSIQLYVELSFLMFRSSK